MRMRPVGRWFLVALFGVLSLLGVPAILSLANPNRERDDIAIVLVAGEDVARLPAR